MPLFSDKRRPVAEIDLIAVKDGYCDIYEVKCSYRITKARKQLEKIKKIISEFTTVRKMFFFCGESKSIVKI